MRAGAVRAAPPAAVPRPSARTRTGVLAAGLAGAVVLLAVLVLLSVLVGSQPVPWRAVVAAATRFDPTDDDQLIVATLRLPRTAVALLAGVALGLAGAVMQGLTRNPLADPGLLGVNAGASLAMVCGIGIFGVTGFGGYLWFGFAGAVGAAVLVHRAAALGRGGVTPVKLAVTGAAVSAALGSLTTTVLLTRSDAFEQFRFWQVGSLATARLDVVGQALPFVLVGGVLALASGRVLNALALGDEVAGALGVRLGLTWGGCAAVVVLLCGAATAVAGPLTFVGLAVPHAARLVTGADHRWTLPYSAVLAPALLLAADVIGRVVAPPGEVQAGVVVAALGAPVLVLLVRRARLAEL